MKQQASFSTSIWHIFAKALIQRNFCQKQQAALAPVAASVAAFCAAMPAGSSKLKPGSAITAAQDTKGKPMAEVDLNFLAHQIERVLYELRSMRDELRVNTAMVQRCSNAVVDQAETLNAIHQWMIGINDRIRRIENAE